MHLQAYQALGEEMPVDHLQMSLSEEVSQVIQALGFEPTQQLYWAQNECIFLERFLPADAVEHWLLPDVDRLRADVHRNYIPRHKKGGSVSYYALMDKVPVFLELYRSPAFIDFMSRLVKAPLMPCPTHDP